VKLLLDENFPIASARILRDAGYDIVSVSELMPGISDIKVLNVSVQDQRALVTFDRDYGNLIFYRQKPSPISVLYMRFVPKFPSEPALVLQSFLKASVRKSTAISLSLKGTDAVDGNCQTDAELFVLPTLYSIK
jgi:predicted nuclease of predicted toxin-antitoxin system